MRVDRLAVAPILGALVLFAPPARAGAQAARESLARGIGAYHALEFEASARILRQVLARPDAETLGDSTQAEAFGFVGAAEFLLGRRQEATLAFASALERSPTFRLDTLVFPPAVTTVFESTRRSTALVSAHAGMDTTFSAGDPAFRARLIASAPHVIRIAVCDADGGIARMLYEGRITDSLWVAWDGLLTSGGPATDGRMSLCAESVAADGAARWMRLPLRVTRVEPPRVAGRDATVAATRVAPGSSAVRRTPRKRAMAVGITAAVLAVGLPAAVTTSGQPQAWRFVVSGALVSAALLTPRITTGPVAIPSSMPVGAPAKAAPPVSSAVPPVPPRLRVVALQRDARSRAP